jgi:hypothetical protein
MDGIQTFRNKAGRWAGSIHLQVIPTSGVRLSNLIQTLVTILRGSVDSNQLQHKTTAVAFITADLARAIHLARPYPNKQKRNELSSFHARSVLSQPNPIHTPTSHFLEIHLNTLTTSHANLRFFAFLHYNYETRMTHIRVLTRAWFLRT